MTTRDPDIMTWFCMAEYLDLVRDKNPDMAHGNGLKALRRETTSMGHPRLTRPQVEACESMARLNYDAIVGLDGPNALPIDPVFVIAAIDALCFRLSVSTRREAWEAIGLNPLTGKGWVAQGKGGMAQYAPWALLRAALMRPETAKEGV